MQNDADLFLIRLNKKYPCGLWWLNLLFQFTGQGVESVKILLEDKTVLVTSTLPADQLLETIKKTGKETTYVGVKE